MFQAITSLVARHRVECRVRRASGTKKTNKRNIFLAVPIARFFLVTLADRTRKQATFGQPLGGPQLVQVPRALSWSPLRSRPTKKKYSRAFAVDLTVLLATGAPLLSAGNHGVLCQRAPSSFIPLSLSFNPLRFVPTLFLVHFREAPYDTS